MKKIIVSIFFLFLILAWACDWMLDDSVQTTSCGCSRLVEPALQDTWSLPKSVPGVSRYNSDCHPSITADGHLMAFCTAQQNGPAYDTLHIGLGFNVYTAHWTGITWDSVRNVGRHINPASYPTISSGGESLFVFKGNKIWMSIWQDSMWSNPLLLPYPVNDANPGVADGPCAISLNGHQLYFKSTRSGGNGSGDIWVVRITPTGCDSLTNLGPNVNTSDMETHPAISPDGQRLYFSDFGGARPVWKYGDCDVFVSHWSTAGWGPAQILEAPVNTDLPCCSAFETVDGRLYLGSEVSEGTYGEEDVWVCESGTDKADILVFTGKYSRSWQNTGELIGATYVYDLIESGGAIYAATAPNGDVFKTTDGGGTWYNTSDISVETHIYSLAECLDSSILAGTYPNGKVFRTTDGGTTWNQIAAFPYAHGVRKIFQKSDGTLFAGTSPDSFRLGRVWRSTNNGSTWQRTGDLNQTAGGTFCFTEVPGGAMLAGGRTYGDKYYVSLNNGNTWNIQNLPYADSSVTLSHLYFFYRTSDTRLWTGGWAHGPQGILLHSTDNGVNWDTCGEIPNGDMIVARVFDMVEGVDGSYYIGFHPGPDSVVFRSTDSGITWHNCGVLNGAYEALCLLKTSDGTIYAGTTPNGDVFKYAPTAAQENDTGYKTQNARIEVFPNPFSQNLNIRCIMQEPRYAMQDISLKIYDVSGRNVMDLTANVEYSIMDHGWVINWNSTDYGGQVVPPGVYFCCLRGNDYVISRKLVKLK